MTSLVGFQWWQSAQQGIQGSSIAITRDGDALDLEAFRFA